MLLRMDNMVITQDLELTTISLVSKTTDNKSQRKSFFYKMTNIEFGLRL